MNRPSGSAANAWCWLLTPKKTSHKKDKWVVTVKAGTERTDIDAVEWAVRAEKLGAGEILLTSMDADGTQAGYDIELTRAVAEAVHIPVIASGGAGTLESLYEVLDKGKASAVLAASIFHYGTYTIDQTKEFLASPRRTCTAGLIPSTYIKTKKPTNRYGRLLIFKRKIVFGKMFLLAVGVCLLATLFLFRLLTDFLHITAASGIRC